MEFARRVQSFSESEAMLLLQEDSLEYNYKSSKALGALNSARCLVHNVFGFTGGRVDQAKTCMYMYQIVLCFVSRSLTVKGAALQDVMEDEQFHRSLITVCLEVVAFLYRDEDGRFSEGFPVLTNIVHRSSHLPEFLACLDWFVLGFGNCQCWGGGEIRIPILLMDYLSIVRDAILEEGIVCTQCNLLMHESPPSSLLSYAVRNVVLYLDQKVEQLVCKLRESDLGLSSGCLIRASKHMLGVILRSRLDLLLESTCCSLLVVCSVYCTSRVAGRELRFSLLAEICGLKKDIHSHRSFYNEKFLPLVYSFREIELYGAYLKDWDPPMI
jgi:hypothetical protein